MTAVRRLADALGLDAHRGVMLCRDTDIRWVTSGYDGEGLVLVTGEEAILFTDPRWSGPQVPGFRVVCSGSSLVHALAVCCRNLQLQQLYYPQEQISHARYRRLKELLDGQVALLPVSRMLRQLRGVKQQEETELIRRACRVTCNAFGRMIPLLKEGITERRAASLFSALLFEEGADWLAFPTMISFGEHTTQCHFEPGDRQLRQGDAVMVDAGAAVGGYTSDFTRMLCLGTPSPELLRLHGAVLEAQDSAIAVLKAGARCRDVDAAGRRSLQAAGIDFGFVHALGHGLGLDIHEWPSLNGGSADVLQPDMAVAIQPAVYTDRLGVRIEDTLLVTGDGAQLLTPFPRDLIIL